MVDFRVEGRPPQFESPVSSQLRLWRLLLTAEIQPTTVKNKFHVVHSNRRRNWRQAARSLTKSSAHLIHSRCATDLRKKTVHTCVSVSRYPDSGSFRWRLEPFVFSGSSKGAVRHRMVGITPIEHTHASQLPSSSHRIQVMALACAVARCESTSCSKTAQASVHLTSGLPPLGTVCHHHES